eukprot:scaffold23893_cov25-Tisochrysis_lutea.AAC.2
MHSLSPHSYYTHSAQQQARGMGLSGFVARGTPHLLPPAWKSDRSSDTSYYGRNQREQMSTRRRSSEV